MRLAPPFLLALVALPGCATFIDGTEQAVTLRTAPVGASCVLQSGADIVGRIPSTPGTLLLHKEKQDLAVVCQKAGWNSVATTIPSQFTGVTAGNVLAGGLIGIVVDEATRANYRYREDTMILLTPAPPAGVRLGRPVAGAAPRRLSLVDLAG